MEKSKKVFVFNTAWYKIIRNCSTLVKGEVFTAVMEYAESGKIIELSNEANVIFQFIKREIDKREVRRQKASKTADKPAPVRQTNQPETTTETGIINNHPSPQPAATESAPIKPFTVKNITSNTYDSKPTLPLTRQMRRKLQRQGIELPANPPQV